MSASAATADLWSNRTAGRARQRGWRTELLLFAAAYVVYNLTRWIFVGDLGAAREHARWIFELEKGAGVAIEGSVQRALDPRVASFLLSNLYLAAQLVVVPCVLVWLYRRAPHLYRQLRNTVVATWLIAVPVFALFPVAPPRLAGIGIADTVSQQATVQLTGRSTIFYNQLAAVPSLHVGFAVAVGIALAIALRRRWAKALALLWGPIVSLSVVATGNHYLFDIAAGLMVTALGFAAGRLASRRAGAEERPVTNRVAKRRRVEDLRAASTHGRPHAARDERVGMGGVVYVAQKPPAGNPQPGCPWMRNVSVTDERPV